MWILEYLEHHLQASAGDSMSLHRGGIAIGQQISHLQWRAKLLGNVALLVDIVTTAGHLRQSQTEIGY